MPTPEKLVVLKLDGDLEQQGFRVALEIGWEGDRTSADWSVRPAIERMASLPPDPSLVLSLEQWQQAYRSLGIPSRIIPQEIIYGGSVNWQESCQQTARALRDRFNRWLDAEEFRWVDRCLRESLNLHEPVRMVVRTQDWNVRRLPWHLWNLLEHYTQIEISLSSLTVQRFSSSRTATPDGKVKILAILGNCAGINVETDRNRLQQLPNAAVTFLVEPPRQQLNQQLWQQPWDILFFAGHSQTEGEAGRLYINPQESLTLEELKYGLRRAISRGLQLAIFNSCDGLGLAQELEHLHLPQLIVMREPVPDPVAQEFLHYFLDALVQGEPLYLAARQAREQLQGLEGNFPCASWLPVIFQHSLDWSLSWQGLLGNRELPATAENADPEVSATLPENQPAILTRSLPWKSWRLTLLASWLVTSLVMGLRFLGWLQPLELLAFDHLMRLRPTEQPDDRLLLITIDESDLHYQNKQGMQRQGSLSDAALNQLLKKLEPHQPIAIGLDIYRDRPLASNQPELKSRLQHLIAVCTIGNSDKAPPIKPPPELPLEQIGFANLPLDPDDRIRRYTIGMAPDADCQTSQSFSYLLAQRYLARRHLPSRLVDTGLYIGSQVFPSLESHTGGYHQPGLGGYEVLLNYRAAQPIARQISLTKILNGSMDGELAALVRDRIVLIGTIAPTFRDYHLTPYGEKSGVEIHAHMVSQILSAVLDGRPIFWYLPQWGDALWIWAWGMVAGIVGLSVASRIRLILAGVVVAGALYGCCFLILLQAGWVPLIPAALVLAGTGGSVIALKSKI